MSSLFSATQLVKSYHRRNVVNGVSLHVKTGEVVGLLGPNGAGKTTSFYMMVGLVRTDSGEITLDSEKITRYPMHLRAQKGVGYLPQEPSIFRALTVADNIRAVLEVGTSLSASQIDWVIDDLLREFNILHLRGQPAMSLSGGERRRLEIARVLATRPKFVLLDEPFAGVDPISVEDIKKTITHLKERGIGVLITEHNVRETLGICDRAYILNNGKVIAEGNTAAIVANEEVRTVYLGKNFSL